MIALSTLAKANERRDWRIWRDYAMVLIKEALTLYANDPPGDLDIDAAVYAIDSTTIELCLNLFPWAKIAAEEASIKLHLALSLQGNIPSFFDFSRGREADVKFLDRLIFESGAYYVMDRGYLDFDRLYSIHSAGVFFVTRAKKNFRYRRLYSRFVDPNTPGIRSDQIIKLDGIKTKEAYPNKLRRISYVDAETGQRYAFLTNDFETPAQTIADLYKHRWQVELFFKWIKQHLAIKSFWGRSANAVKTQVCIAICAYLLVAIMKKKCGIRRNSYEILQILSVSLFDKNPITKLISEYQLQINETPLQKQLKLWDC
ncbi:MAG: transposase [Bacteroidetes bacterium RIFCSPHIGHO2_02_FULL_44_7]|nr:MAG: transposase [Bacteroidetes bacterium RIFCSPHIGHO2_02_FULL_44_7]